MLSPEPPPTAPDNSRPRAASGPALPSLRAAASAEVGLLAHHAVLGEVRAKAGAYLGWAGSKALLRSASCHHATEAAAKPEGPLRGSERSVRRIEQTAWLPWRSR